MLCQREFKSYFEFGSNTINKKFLTITFLLSVVILDLYFLFYFTLPPNKYLLPILYVIDDIIDLKIIFNLL